MRIRTYWRLWVVVCSLVVGRTASAGPLAAERIRSAAAAFVDQVRTGPICPPSWRSANIHAAETVVNERGRWHVCRLAEGQKPAGYVLVSEKGGVAMVVAFSGSVMPPQLIGALTTPAVGQSMLPPPAIRTVRDVLLVQCVRREDGTFPVSTTPLGSAAASVLCYLQCVKGYPLFGYAGVLNPETYRLFPSPANVSPLQEQKNRAGVRAMSDKTGEQRTSFTLEKHRLLKAKGMVEEVEVQRRGSDRTVRQIRLKDDPGAFAAVAALRRSYLLAPGGPDVRRELIEDEDKAAMGVLSSVEQSAGMRAAYILENAYLTVGGSLEQNVEAFFLTRGFRASCGRKPVASASPGDLPYVVLGSPQIVGVVLGDSEGADPRWAVMCLPDTVTAHRENVWDTSRRMQAARDGRDPHAVTPLVSTTTRASSPPVRFIDPLGNPPGSLDRGVHVVLVSTLSEWQAIIISKPALAENWGSTNVTFQERQGQ